MTSMTWYVNGSGKLDGDIVSLCGSGWHHEKLLVMSNKALHGHRYYVNVQDAPLVEVHVRYRNGKPYLTTGPDGYAPNNLDNLRDC